MNDEIQSFLDRLGRFFEDNGLPRMAGRVMGHLLTCDPPEQTFEEVVAALGASRSSVSVATRLLVQQGMVERFGVPRDRRDRYRVGEDAWTMLLKQDIAAAAALKRLADEGLSAVRAQPPGARARLRAMKAFYTFLEEAYAPLLAKWENRAPKARARRRSP